MDPITIPYEPVPIGVAALMAEVPQNRAIWFVHLVPPLLAFTSFASLPSPALQSMTTWDTAAC